MTDSNYRDRRASRGSAAAASQLAATVCEKRFPWHAVERVTRAEVRAHADIRRCLCGYVDLDVLSSTLREMLKDDSVKVIVQGVRPMGFGVGSIPGGAAVIVAPADGASVLAHGVLIEVELPLALAAVASFTGTPSRDLLGSPRIPAVFAALVREVVRRAHRGLALRIVSAGPTQALAADMHRLGQELYAVTLTVIFGDNAYEARIVVPQSAMIAAPRPSWNLSLLRAMGPTPIAVPIVGWTQSTMAGELGALAAGDAWMLEDVLRAPSGAPVGPVVLAAPDATMGVTAELRQDGQLVFGGDVVAVCAADVDKEAEMDTTVSDDKGGLVEVVGDVPVVVRVELGEARMPARDWANLTRGDVIGLGSRIGGAVLLRVGGVPVARGDLVDIDGEVGVRITERIGQAAP